MEEAAATHNFQNMWTKTQTNLCLIAKGRRRKQKQYVLESRFVDMAQNECSYSDILIRRCQSGQA